MEDYISGNTNMSKERVFQHSLRPGLCSWHFNKHLGRRGQVGMHVSRKVQELKLT